MTLPPKSSVIQGWAAFDRSGRLLWGTLRPTKAEAVSRFERFNPSVDGEPRRSTDFSPIRITLAGAPQEPVEGEKRPNPSHPT